MSVKTKFKDWLYTNYPGSKQKVENFFADAPLLRKLLRVGFTPTFQAGACRRLPIRRGAARPIWAT